MKVAKLSVAGEVLVPHVWVAERMLARMRGLLGRTGLPANTAMLLRPCNSIHTLGMQFSLDVIFLDRKQRVTRIKYGLQPWRFASGGPRAHAAIEMQAGAFNLSSVERGMPLDILF